MELFKKQLLKLTFIFITSLLLSAITFTHLKAKESFLVSKGSITMEDTLLKVSTGLTEEVVVGIKIKSIDTSINYSIDGCRAHNCTYNLDFLPKGKYNLTVKTSNNTISVTIVIN